MKKDDDNLEDALLECLQNESNTAVGRLTAAKRLMQILSKERYWLITPRKKIIPTALDQFVKTMKEQSEDEGLYWVIDSLDGKGICRVMRCAEYEKWGVEVNYKAEEEQHKKIIEAVKPIKTKILPKRWGYFGDFGLWYDDLHPQPYHPLLPKTEAIT